MIERFFENPDVISEMSNNIDMMKRLDDKREGLPSMQTLLCMMMAEILTLRALIDIHCDVDQKLFDTMRDTPLHVLHRLIEEPEGEG